MAIPESQLDTWSHQGSITQSSNTYNAIKGVLEGAETPYAGKNYKVFLQGSYGNDTNIYAESDVDIAIKLKNCFQHGLSELPEDQKVAFKSSHSDVIYTHANFKADVLSVLMGNYGADVDLGKKAITIAANGNRRKADVIVAIQYRRYSKFLSISNQLYDEGICFYTENGEKIANYPKYHAENLTKKHQNTYQWFKPMARILKNLRGRLISEGMLENGVAPSYYLEGLLYNVPDEHFGKSYGDTFVNSIKWIQDADRKKFVCANQQYYLLRDEPHFTWQKRSVTRFLQRQLNYGNSGR